MRILLAEDDFVTRKFMSNFLSKYGECDVTVDGLEAVDAFMMALEDGEPYDLVCLDIMMPVMDGYETTKIIRKFTDKQIAEIPIIALTADAFAEEKSRAFNAGMNAYLVKPVDMASLLKVLMLFFRDNKRS